jgi:hypothetical protein
VKGHTEQGVSTFEKSATATNLTRASADYRDLLTRLGKLGSVNLRVSSPATATDLPQLIGEITDWNSSDGIDQRGFFILKFSLLYRAFRLATDEASSKQAVQGFVRFLENSEGEMMDEPATWLYSMNEMLSLSRTKGPSINETLVAQLLQSRATPVRLYGELEARIANLGGNR